MSISDLPLSYCTNVHPGRTLDEVIANLDKYAVPVAERYGRPMGVGLWFAASVMSALQPEVVNLDEPARTDKLREWLDDRGVTCYTLNAFPFGDFHARQVKQAVYQPDWSTGPRLDYTVDCAGVVAALLSAGDEGSISTLPLGFKDAPHDDTWVDRCIKRLILIAGCIEGDRGLLDRVIRVAIEPEPLCVIETTDEAIAFFHQLWKAADAQSGKIGEIVREHIGLCYDICHQAVEFEDAAESIAKIDAAGIRINKVQISNAIEVVNPRKNEAARAALRDYVDERYLHQTFGLMPESGGGSVMRVTDLTHEFLDDPGPMLDATRWRIHYHVPVNEHQIGALGTTHGEVRKALEAIAKLDYAPHLEVETYTWSVMPEEHVDLVAGLAAEMTATAKLLDEIRAQG